MDPVRQAVYCIALKKLNNRDIKKPIRIWIGRFTDIWSYNGVWLSLPMDPNELKEALRVIEKIKKGSIVRQVESNLKGLELIHRNPIELNEIAKTVNTLSLSEKQTVEYFMSMDVTYFDATSYIENNENYRRREALENKINQPFGG